MGELMGGGKLDVEGPRRRVALVRAMIDQLDDDVQPSDLLHSTVSVVFGQVMDIPHTNPPRPAVGDTQSATKVRIRHGIMGAADLRPYHCHVHRVPRSLRACPTPPAASD